MSKELLSGNPIEKECGFFSARLSEPSKYISKRKIIGVMICACLLRGWGLYASYMPGMSPEGINLVDTTSSTTGIISKEGIRFIHNFSHPTGGGAVPEGYNTFVGAAAGNFTMGSTAASVKEASYNVGIGYSSLRLNTTGSSNVASGYSSLYSNTTGSSNVASGSYSLYSNTSGSYNMASGYFSLYSNTTGSSNVASGYQAGRYAGAIGSTLNQTGTNNIFLGRDTRASANGVSNEVVIGYGAVGQGSNTVILGNSDVGLTYLRGKVAIGTIVPPGVQLDLAGTTDATGTTNTGVLEIGGSLRLDGNELITNTNTALYIQNDNNGDLRVDGTTFMVDASANRVGIGDTTPSYTLDVAGDIRTQTTYRSSDGTAGYNGTWTFKDYDSQVNTIIIKDGLITSVTQS